MPRHGPACSAMHRDIGEHWKCSWDSSQQLSSADYISSLEEGLDVTRDKVEFLPPEAAGILVSACRFMEERVGALAASWCDWLGLDPCAFLLWFGTGH